MYSKNSPQNVIRKFEKRQRAMPFMLGALAVILVIVGVFIIIAVVSGNNNPLAGLLATKTATVTVTFTPTATQPSPTPSMTPTITETPTPEATGTPAGPYQYVVKEGDNCWLIAYEHQADQLLMIQLNPGIFNDPNNECPIHPGTILLIPAPWQKMPTPTKIPADVERGSIFIITVMEGDTLQSIADYYNSTLTDILQRNEIDDPNSIGVGDKIKVRVNIATTTPTSRPTSTPANQTPTPSPTK